MATQALRNRHTPATGFPARGPESLVAKALPLLLAATRGEDALERLKRATLRHPEILAGHLMRGRRGTWKRAVEGLPTADLDALIRLLTLAEAHLPDWEAGSGSTVIWLFQLYAGRPGADEHALADWILRHGTNAHAPYGTRNHGARTLEDFRARRQAALEEEKPSRPPERPVEPAPPGLGSFRSLGLVRALGGILPIG